MEDSANQGGVYAVSAILIAASTLAVGLRIRVRRMKKTYIGVDDWTIFAALILSYGLAIVLIYGAAQGTLGTHTALDPKTGLLITTWHEQQSSELSFVGQMIAIVAYGMMKTSVLLLYRRIFVGKIFNKISMIALAITIAWTISFFFATLFQCGGDPTLYWQSSQTVKIFCSDYKPIWLGHAVSDVGIDLVILSIPIPIIWKLHMSVLQRMALIFIFLLGLLSTAAATTRVVFIAEDLYETTTGARDLRGLDTNIMVWGYIEGAIGVIAACLPTLKSIVHGRMVDSIVNSVRSALSIGSTAHTRKQSDADTVDTAPDNYELAERQLYTGPDSAVQTHIESGSATHLPLQVPEAAIVAQTEVVMDENRAREP